MITPAAASGHPLEGPPQFAARVLSAVQSTDADAAALAHLLDQAAGRLTSLSAMFSAEAVSGSLGARALASEGQAREAAIAVAQTRRIFSLEHARLRRDLETLARPGALIDLTHPYRSPYERLLAALSELAGYAAACGAAVREPLERASGSLRGVGVRIVLGATDVRGESAARVATYGKRFRDLAELLGAGLNALDFYQQGTLAGLESLRRAVVQDAPRRAGE